MSALLARKFIYLFFLLLILQSCATYHSQSGNKNPAVVKDDFTKTSDISHTFYLIGDAGNADDPEAAEVLQLFEQQLRKADTSSTLIFLGDNIYPKGMPPKGSENRAQAEDKMNRQLALADNFKGRSVVIPGNHDWYSGLDGLKEQEKFVNDYLKKERSFLPAKSCAIDRVAINANVDLLVVDSHWYLEDWDKYPEINAECAIRNREQFFEELEALLTLSQNKTTILALHHPLMTHGSHGGEYTVRKHLFPLEQDIPLPVVGTVANLVRKTSGILLQDIQNKKYSELVNRIKTIVRNRKNVVIVSGHDHNLQYIDADGIKQVISGSGSKTEGARAINENDFSFGRNGYAILQVHKNGAAKVSFFGADSKGKESLLAVRQPIFAREKPNLREFTNSFAATKDTSIYTDAMTEKSRTYRLLWGNHFRKQYSTPIRVRQVRLDTLFGGLKPTIIDNDEQSRALVLTDKNGKQYVMRALKKSATRFLQSVAFKDQSVEEDFKDTYTEDFILDFYTTSHPYMPLVVSMLADKSDVNHTNPKLFYVPKQNPLGLFNDEFGDELYMIEELPTDKFRNLSSFGKPLAILTTEEVLHTITTDKKYAVDEAEYMRARLFDMLIGDWDRDEKQWNWGEYHEKGKVIYRPIPHSRVHAFTKFDGLFFKVIMNFKVIRQMKTFDEDLKSVRWFNREAYNLDLAFLPNATRDDWLKQAAFIEKNLSDAEIDRAFKNLPKEMQDKTADQIREQLKIRKNNLGRFAETYYQVLQSTVILTGTSGKDLFVINRSDRSTKVQIFEERDDKQELKFERTYFSGETKQLWIYGLGEEDTFEVAGDGRKEIMIRLMGGQDKDVYKISNGQKVKIYDFLSTDNDLLEAGSAKLVLTDTYDKNTYDYERAKFNLISGHPLIGYNPDDGLKLGLISYYTVNAFNSYPLTQRHSLSGNYYFGTGGYEFAYKGNFPHVFGKWNLITDILYTSPNFSENFFGFGNETQNPEDEFDMDYNRVKIGTIKVAPSLQWIGEQGAAAVFQAAFESNRVEATPGRFISETGVVNPRVFDYQNFADISAKYSFENYDNASNPTLGMTFSVMGGYVINIGDTDRRFPYAESSIGFNYRLSTTGNWVLATILKGRALLDNDYEFYQAATVGGDTDLRGFRNERFAGKQSFYQSTDLRLNLGKLRNGLAPVNYGVFGGFDYGRVWLEDDFSDKWHQSFGGGVWLNGINVVTAKLSYFYSDDGGRISFGLGFGF
jgi:hypothetical protein